MTQTGERSLSLTKASVKPADLRKFGILVGSVFAVLGAFPLIKGKHLNLYLLITGAAIFCLGVIAPKLLSPLYAGWMKVGKVLGKVNTFLILSLIFYLIVTPFGFAYRIFSSNSKKFSYKTKRNSYWIKRNPASPKNDMKRAF